MAGAATKFDFSPRTLSFKMTSQTLQAFQPVIAFTEGQGLTARMQLYESFLVAISVHRVGDRPDRIEPRKRKSTYRRQLFLTVPRDEAKRQILKKT